MKRPIDLLLEFAKRKGWRDAELSRNVGISQQNLKHWKERDVSAEKRLDVAELLGISVAALMNGGTEPKKRAEKGAHPIFSSDKHAGYAENAPRLLTRGARVPLITWTRIVELAVGESPEPEPDGAFVFAREVDVSTEAFASRVEGPSMTAPPGAPISFPPGTVIIVDPEVSPQPGHFVIARDASHTPTFKQLVRDGSRWFLYPLNPAFLPPQEITSPPDVLGVVVEWWQGGRIAY